jgi:hypothetical protein
MEKDQAGITWQEGERRGNIDRMIALLMDTVLQVAELGPRVLQDQQQDERKRNLPIAMLSISCLVKSGQLHEGRYRWKWDRIPLHPFKPAKKSVHNHLESKILSRLPNHPRLSPKVLDRDVQQPSLRMWLMIRNLIYQIVWIYRTLPQVTAETEQLEQANQVVQQVHEHNPRMDNANKRIHLPNYVSSLLGTFLHIYLIRS